MKATDILAGILDIIEISIKTGNGRVIVEHRNSSAHDRCEVLLPNNASSWDEQIMVDINGIRDIRTEHNWDYFLVLSMYDGRTIKIKYSFHTELQNDLSMIMKMRGVHNYRGRTTFGPFRYAF